jgi:hypothetical protein
VKSLKQVKHRIKTLEFYKDKRLINNLKSLSINVAKGNITERKRSKEKKKCILKYKPSKCGDLWQIDSVNMLEQGAKRYFINAIELKPKFAFSQCYNALNSANAKDFFLKLMQVSPIEIRRIQTDNGLEFYGFFEEQLKKKTISHF